MGVEIGKTYGNLTVLKNLGMRYPTKNSSRKRRYALVECVCGKKVEIRADQVKRNNSCGCLKGQHNLDSIPIGEKFERLEILRDMGMKYPNIDSSKKTHYVEVKCDCGKIYETCWRSIKRGDTKSCGCYQRDKIKEVNTTHGDSNTRLYEIWEQMIGRCYNENNPAYKYYGSRGITICNSWKNNYSVFKQWAINNGYEEDLTIDRIDVLGDYEPSNCQWLTRSENSRKSNTIDKKRREKNENI